jgi:hypothetical protein
MKISQTGRRTNTRAARSRSLPIVARVSALAVIVSGVLASLCVAPTFARTPSITGQEFNTNTPNPVFTTFFVGTDSNLYSMTYPYNSGNWGKVTGVQNRPAVSTGSGVLSSFNDHYGQPEMFYLTTTAANATHIEQSYTGLNTPYDLSALSATPASALPSPTSTLGAFSDDCADSDNVFYLGTDKHIHVLTWSPGHPWKEEDLTALAGGVSVAGNQIGAHESQASEEIFYTEANGHVAALWRWSGCPGFGAFNGWHNSDVTAAVPGAALAISGSPLTGFYDGSVPLDAVFYIDTTHHVQELFHAVGYPTNGPWQKINLTTATGLPVAVAGGPLVSQLHGTGLDVSTEEVSYFDSSGHIWQFVSAPETGSSNWGGAEPSAGFPPAAAGSPLFTDVNHVVCFIDCELGDSADEYYYLTSDNHVHRLSIIPNQQVNWVSADITATTGAPVAAP